MRISRAFILLYSISEFEAKIVPEISTSKSQTRIGILRYFILLYAFFNRNVISPKIAIAKIVKATHNYPGGSLFS